MYFSQLCQHTHVVKCFCLQQHTGLVTTPKSPPPDTPIKKTIHQLIYEEIFSSASPSNKTEAHEVGYMPLVTYVLCTLHTLRVSQFVSWIDKIAFFFFFFFIARLRYDLFIAMFIIHQGPNLLNDQTSTKPNLNTNKLIKGTAITFFEKRYQHQIPEAVFGSN